MPLMKLACTALERVPLIRSKIIDSLMQRFNQDLVFCRAPDDDVLTSGVHGIYYFSNFFIASRFCSSLCNIEMIGFDKVSIGNVIESLFRSIHTLLTCCSWCDCALCDMIVTCSYILSVICTMVFVF